MRYTPLQRILQQKCYLFIDKFFHGCINSMICMNRISITYEAVEIPAEFRELPVVWNCGLWIFLLGTGEDSAVVECCGYFCVLPCLGSFVWSFAFVKWKKSFINHISILLYNISMTLKAGSISHWGQIYLKICHDRSIDNFSSIGSF